MTESLSHDLRHKVAVYFLNTTQLSPSPEASTLFVLSQPTQSSLNLYDQISYIQFISTKCKNFIEQLSDYRRLNKRMFRGFVLCDSRHHVVLPEL